MRVSLDVHVSTEHTKFQTSLLKNEDVEPGNEHYISIIMSNQGMIDMIERLERIKDYLINERDAQTSFEIHLSEYEN